jgi:sugar O-acyltransferase (sialic acid O-acetyltransferase NeuD family)
MIAIYGAGGFAREVHWLAKRLGIPAIMVVDSQYYELSDKYDVRKFDDIDPLLYDWAVAISDCHQRQRIVERLPADVKWARLVDPAAIVGANVTIGEGSIICAGAVLTANIKLGRHCHINLNATIGHDTSVGDFCTFAPAVNISGNNTIEDCIYFGTNSCTREKIRIQQNTLIGMGAVVVHTISIAGTYFGNPAKRRL